VASRFPPLVQDYYARAPGRVLATLAEAFADFSRRGLLEVEDPEVAAEQFIFLAVGASLDRALFGTDDSSMSPDAVESRAAAGARAFLRAYRRA
jgi:TetR/AcrR family transcriptional repressor of mexJK operon